MNVVYSAPSEYDLKGIPNHVPGDETQQILFRNLGFTNPYWWADHNEYRQHTNRVFGNAYVEYQPKLDWGDNMTLKFREQAGLDIWTSDYLDLREVGSTSSLPQGDIENYGTQHNVFNNLFTINFDGRFGIFDFVSSDLSFLPDLSLFLDLLSPPRPSFSLILSAMLLPPLPFFIALTSSSHAPLTVRTSTCPSGMSVSVLLSSDMLSLRSHLMFILLMMIPQHSRFDKAISGCAAG